MAVASSLAQFRVRMGGSPRVSSTEGRAAAFRGPSGASFSNPRRHTVGKVAALSQPRGSAASTADLRTPHSGYHYDGRPGQFFEGWYFKVYVPEADTSFALIYSIENPANGDKRAGVGAQIMGPDDGYLLQYSRDAGCFWASPRELELGATFRPTPGGTTTPLGGIVTEAQFDEAVQEGFQASSTLHQGHIVRAEAGATGDLASTVSEARWSFSVEPKTGWGDAGSTQRSTAGWLAALPVFEPHWQIMMSHGEASGWLEWGGRRYTFERAPTYYEKNWGAGFPKRWFWVQCNSFNNYPGLSLTTGGGTRAIPLVPGLEEDVALLCIHYEGQFIELVPWRSEVQWAVEPWGSWKVWGRSDKFEALVEATTDTPGTPLRAPTPEDGLAPYCRDTFGGQARLRIWERDVFGMRKGTPMVDATTTSAALEVGGGPWWSAWKAKAEMSEPLRSFLTLPIEEALTAVPKGLRPPGL